MGLVLFDIVVFVIDGFDDVIGLVGVICMVILLLELLVVGVVMCLNVKLGCSCDFCVNLIFV